MQTNMGHFKEELFEKIQQETHNNVRGITIAFE